MSACTTVPPTLPPAIPCDPSGIPHELRDYPQWVVWKAVPNGDKKPRKVPFNPKTGREAKSGEPSTWGTYDQAVRAFQSGGYAGVGFEFHDTDPFVGGDIDDCRDPETGEITENAGAFLTLADTYAEVSQSGTGVKFIGKGDKVGSACKRGGFEMYSEGRFFALTGCHLEGTPATIEERTAEFAGIYLTWFREPDQAEPPRPATQPRQTTSLADAELLEKASKARNGADFDKLWQGDTSGYRNDHSSADLGLCGMLAFWTGGDADRIDSLFRQSGLFRDKWDERRGKQTYGEMTVEKALLNCRKFYGSDPKNEAEKRPFYYSSVLSHGKICDPEKQSVQISESADEMDVKQWIRVGKAQRQKRDRDEISNRFAIGDWLNMRVRGLNYGNRMQWCKRIFGNLTPEVTKWRSVASAFSTEQRKTSVGWSFYELLASAPPDVRTAYLDRLPEKDLTIERITRELREAGYIATRKPKDPPTGWEAAKASGVTERVAQAIADAAAREGSRPIAHKLETVLGLRQAAREESSPPLSSFLEEEETAETPEQEAQRLVKLLIQRDGACKVVTALRAILEHHEHGGDKPFPFLEPTATDDAPANPLETPYCVYTHMVDAEQFPENADFQNDPEALAPVQELRAECGDPFAEEAEEAPSTPPVQYPIGEFLYCYEEASDVEVDEAMGLRAEHSVNYWAAYPIRKITPKRVFINGSNDWEENLQLDRHRLETKGYARKGNSGTLYHTSPPENAIMGSEEAYRICRQKVNAEIEWLKTPEGQAAYAQRQAEMLAYLNGSPFLSAGVSAGQRQEECR